jgi:hypothetical protein
MDEQALKEVREAIRAAHDLVKAGRYAAAHGALALQLPRLLALLGEGHPEVEELQEDLLTVHDMGGVADFGATMGFRWSDPLKGPPS